MMNDYANMLSKANTVRATLEEKLYDARQSVRQKDERIAELEKEKASHVPVLSWIARECNQVDGDMLHRLKSYLAIRDLEQQSKGCTDGAKACSISFG